MNSAGFWNQALSKSRKCRHLDEIFITSSTWNFDRRMCVHKNRQNDIIHVSVLLQNFILKWNRNVMLTKFLHHIWFNVIVRTRPRDVHCVWQIIGDHFTVHEWAKSQPMTEDLTYVTSSVIGWDFAHALCPWTSCKHDSMYVRCSRDHFGYGLH